ncbi:MULTISPECIES: adenosylcobinamide-phosphate synthase CbiB [Prochlorococcus]|uniref:Cobalamin biosynthesis protein CobD n=1 Tax=Prochlorococcus marinus str. MIT 9116 TaxID=167544 RepID=A0A0A1ZX77_PROMR|nr:adenosylcobinamide-phosphate synthase CbiB [Prochlorococcus marinus]KGF91647.1 Adenosylcobinamide-phosphate synthase [Prochlorococcus marinus str. MIT 9107]KGF93166.1 Adenosylcobinamide-phosphate synthase [Prochlorococcus marinus str. MIT 9116]KGF94239.1 Adenosylcobinamide-phosphate synthase [Prochlorococcus marinus str. MIT 9123]
MAEINLFLIFLGSIGFDLLIGDPRNFIHPVQIIGFYIKKISDYLINHFGENKKILFWGGLIVAISTIGISFSLGKFIELSYMQSRNNSLSGLLIFLGLSSCIATKSLILSVKEIAELIEHKEINYQIEKIIKEKVQRIVSRDVRVSSIEHLLRSSTESLTENSVDGIFGPLFWIFIGIILMKFSIFFPGPLSLGFSYKAISTLDSMIGYKYDYFKYLGFFSAKIEDICTFIPSRLVLITLPIVGSKVNDYKSIIKKSYLDGKKYDSPNSGISEAIFAYISNIKLGGKSVYNNEIIEKPIINANGGICTGEKINLICQLILRLQFLWIIIFILIFIVSSLI